MVESIRSLTRLIWHEEAPPPAAWADLIPLAAAQGLLPLVAWRARQAGWRLPEAVERRLQTPWRQAVAREAAATQQIEQLGQLVAGLDMDLILLKGPAVARRYPHPAARPFRDLDVLVASKKGARLLSRVLAAQGYEPRSACRASVHLSPFYPARGGLRVEIHHALGSGDIDLPIEEVWRAAQPLADVPGWWAMAPADHALYLMLHALQRHALESGLRWLYDLTCWTRDWDPAAWRALVGRAREWGMGPTLQLTCGLWAWAQEIAWDELPCGELLEPPPAPVMTMARQAVTRSAPRLPKAWRDGAGEGIGGWLRYGWTVLIQGGEIGPLEIPGRVAYLVRQHGPSLWRLARGDREARRSWARQRQLYGWLAGQGER